MVEPDTREPPAKAMPGPVNDRLVGIDILRGVALFGVMAINIVYEFRVSIFAQFLPPRHLPAHLGGTVLLTEDAFSATLFTFFKWMFEITPLDAAIASFLDQAISMKAFALFSLLFGIGLAIQFDRLPAEKRVLLLLRRLLVLLAFGLLHMTLIWNGDILTEYALAGLVVLPLLFGPRWLLGIGAFALLGAYVSGVLITLIPLPSAPWMAWHLDEAMRVYGSGSFLAILSFRLDEISAIAPLHVWVFPRTLGLFLLGAFVWRCGALKDPAKNRLWFFAAGFALLIVSLEVDRMAATITLALAYGASIIGAASTPLGTKVLGWAAPLGRMAFTNYLMQSLIFGLVFYGYGLGLFGRLSVSTALCFGIVVYVVQVLASRRWLRRFDFGPLEWLWRTLTYGRMQPMQAFPSRAAGSRRHPAVSV